MMKHVIVAGVFAMMIPFAFPDALAPALFCVFVAFCSLLCLAIASKKKKTADPRVARLIENMDNLQAIALMAVMLKPDAAETEELYEAVMTRAAAVTEEILPSSVIS
uniref:Uncharacterized protein n=1 Tax=Brassica oleracea var. oleracea TaxID=109376 RepID=A0A0D3DIW5_BRAOL